MDTLALRLYGKDDLRLESFELPPIKGNEVLAEVIVNGICMSCHKAAKRGPEHRRVPDDVGEKPIIIGHEFSGRILDVGKQYKGTFSVGQKYCVQPAIVYPGRELEAPGYSFQYIGGNATNIIIPREVLEMNCLLPYEGEGFFKAALSEPISCIVGAFRTSYHQKVGHSDHMTGIADRGAMAILAGAGPMGLGAIDYAVHGPRRPRMLVVTDIDQGRLDRAARVIPVQEARKCGVELNYVNTSTGNPVEELRAFNHGAGYDDTFVFAPVADVLEQAGRLLGVDGCLNFFAGPPDREFVAPVNFYDVHYSGHHIVGSSGGNLDDMVEALRLTADGSLDPAVMITHVGGIDSAAETILNLPNIPGGKKLIYTQKSMPLTALDDFQELGRTDPFFRGLAEITGRNNGLWSVEAEDYMLHRGNSILA